MHRHWGTGDAARHLLTQSFSFSSMREFTKKDQGSAIALILYVEPYALCEWELRSKIDGVSRAAHVGFPRV